MKRIALLSLLMFAAYASAQDRPHFDRIQWTLLAADAGIRGLDAFSTRQMLKGPNHEMFLPDCISHHTPTMYAFSASTVAMNYLGSRYLVRHGHPKMAKAMLVIDIGQDAPWAIHNLFLKH